MKIKDESAPDKAKLATLFSSHHINIVQNTSDIPPVNQQNPDKKNKDIITGKATENDSNIINIKKHQRKFKC